MGSVVKIMEKINETGSPIEIMDNESFSIPFISEQDGKMCLTLFSFTSQFDFGDANEKITVMNIFYINPNDTSEYAVRDAQEVRLTDERIALFSRNNGETEKMPAADKYSRLVELTDEIIHNSGDLKKTVSEYADIISDFVSKKLEPYYLALGHEYFLWLNSLL